MGARTKIFQKGQKSSPRESNTGPSAWQSCTLPAALPCHLNSDKDKAAKSKLRDIEKLIGVEK